MVQRNTSDNYLTSSYKLKPTKDNKELYDFMVEVCRSATRPYNRAGWLMKQQFDQTGKVPNWQHVRDAMIQDHEDAIYGHTDILSVSLAKEQVRMRGKEWKSFLGLLKAKKNGTYNKPVHTPGYRPYDAMSVLYVTHGSISKKSAKEGWLSFTGCPSRICRLPVPYERMKYVRVIPKPGYFRIEMVFEAKHKGMVNSNRSPVYAGVDLGVNNLAAVSIDKPGVKPLIIDGLKLKSENVFYNALIAKKKSELPKAWFQKEDYMVLGKVHSSKAIKVEWDKRDMFIQAYLHWASRQVVIYLKANGVTNLIIGHNDCWKQGIKKSKRLSRKARAHFAYIPFNRFISMLTYKAEKAGIDTQVVEESYTSKTCVLAGELPVKHESYAATRVKRGYLKVKSTGVIINSDVNGACQIVRKCKPDAFSVKADGVEVWDGLLRPLKLYFGFRLRCAPSVLQSDDSSLDCVER